jgi:hypothetical protein
MIAIIGSSDELLALGSRLSAEVSFSIQTDLSPSEFYPVVLTALAYHRVSEIRGELIKVVLDGTILQFSSGPMAALKLADSLKNFFTGHTSRHSHFHLDPFENNGVLAPTNCSLIFQLGGIGE